jgi:hypothetical protein
MDEQAQPTRTAPAGRPGEQPPDPHAGPAGIDVERLADRVYQLLLAEARLGYARGERSGPRKKH